MRCNKLSLIGDPLVGAAEDQHLKEASRRPFELPSLLRDSSPKVSPQQTTGKVLKSTSRQDEACGSAVYVVTCFSFTCSPPSVSPLITIVGYVSAMVGSSISLEESQHFSKRQLGVIYEEEPVNRPRHNAGALCECAGYTHPLVG